MATLNLLIVNNLKWPFRISVNQIFAIRQFLTAPSGTSNPTLQTLVRLTKIRPLTGVRIVFPQTRPIRLLRPALLLSASRYQELDAGYVGPSESSVNKVTDHGLRRAVQFLAEGMFLLETMSRPPTRPNQSSISCTWGSKWAEGRDQPADHCGRAV
jgi:hypothetical protein